MLEKEKKMRELNRIDRITNKINILWRKYPEQRLMQLMLNYFLPRVENDSTLFFLEDDALEGRIDYITKILEKELKKNE